MAILRDDIKYLQKSAINFLYIFVAANARVSADIMQKRNDQLNELSKIYQSNPGYSFRELVQFIEAGIISRYGKTPGQLLQQIYSVSASPAVSGVGSLSDDEAASAVENISVAVSEDGSSKGNKNVWEDIKNVLEWLVAFLQKIFGSYKNPRDYSPASSDWTYGNRPTYLEGSASGKSSLGTLLPVAMTGAVIWFLMKSPNGKIPKRYQRKK